MPDLSTSLDLCTYCPRLCSHTCPVSLAEARETVTPQAKMARYGALRRAPAEVPEVAPLYACTGCGACTEACRYGVQPGVALMQGRAEAPPQVPGLPARHDATARRASTAVAEAVPPERRDAGAKVAYLPACLPRRGPDDVTVDVTATATATGPAAEALSALRVFDRLGIPLALAAVTRGCAGYPLYAAGATDAFRLYAEVFAREVAGHDTLVLGCPACTWLLRTQYPAHGVPLRPQARHLSEHLAPLAADLPIRRQVPQAVYHDPCYLGRHLHAYDAPRALVQRAVARPEEFPLNRAEAACSGGGGLLPVTAPETARAIARERLAGRPADGAVVVTACPSCQRQFSREGARTLGLLELLDAATAP